MASFGNFKDLLIHLTNVSSSIGKDAKKIVILKGDPENSLEKGCVKKEDIARKYAAYFQSILHHNNGYFIQVIKQFQIRKYSLFLVLDL